MIKRIKNLGILFDIQNMNQIYRNFSENFLLLFDHLFVK
jgi:hypothetical protein